jgi:hypothetical protein
MATISSQAERASLLPPKIAAVALESFSSLGLWMLWIHISKVSFYAMRARWLEYDLKSVDDVPFKNYFLRRDSELGSLRLLGLSTELKWSSLLISLLTTCTSRILLLRCRYLRPTFTVECEEIFLGKIIKFLLVYTCFLGHSTEIYAKWTCYFEYQAGPCLSCPVFWLGDQRRRSWGFQQNSADTCYALG